MDQETVEFRNKIHRLIQIRKVENQALLRLVEALNRKKPVREQASESNSNMKKNNL